MALIKCPECGKDISEKAFKCLYCGAEIESKVEEDECQLASISKNENTQKSNNGKMDYKQLGIVSIVLGGLAWIVGIIKIFRETYIYFCDSINVIYFSSLLVIIGGFLIVSGILLMIYEVIQDNRKAN